MRKSVSRLLAAVPVAALLVAAAAMPAFADPRDFTLVNNSSEVLTHLFVSPSETDAWGGDVLGRDILSPSETASVSFATFDGSSCFYDVKVLSQTGNQGVLLKVDLCSTDTVTFSDQA
jgi:hypothetical protein